MTGTIRTVKTSQTILPNKLSNWHRNKNVLLGLVRRDEQPASTVGMCTSEVTVDVIQIEHKYYFPYRNANRKAKISLTPSGVE